MEVSVHIQALIIVPEVGIVYSCRNSHCPSLDNSQDCKTLPRYNRIDYCTDNIDTFAHFDAEDSDC